MEVKITSSRVKDLAWTPVAAGILAAFIGFSSTFTLILKALLNTGATLEQAITGLMAVSIGMGLVSCILSFKYRMPISGAWSTPGAAILIGMKQNDFSSTVGALIVTSVLLILASLCKPINTLIAKIPTTIASAMLAGIIFNLCISPVHAFYEYPFYMTLILLTWLVMLKVKRVLAIPSAAIMALIVVYLITDITKVNLLHSWPKLNIIFPKFELSSFINISIPLFIVTMASQNFPGLTILKVNGYEPEARPLIFNTGLASLLLAPFGGPSIGLAAITAAICAGEDAGDKDKRYWAGIVCGLLYILFGIFSSVVTKIIYLAPPILIESVAGLALIGAFGNSLLNALSAKEDREAAVITFLIAVSGHVFLGINGSFWGLILGIILVMFLRYKRT